jgi:sugar phosphate isomerase/epimerase
MRLALNTVTLSRDIAADEAIKVAATAGFEGVGLWYDRLVALEEQAGSLDPVTDQGPRVEEICYLGGWMWATGEARDDALAAAEARAEMAAAVGSPLVIACASGGTGDPAQAAADFQAICDLGAKFGVVMALEYIGAFEQYHDIKSGLELVRAADHPNGKLLIDIFHSFRGGTVVEDFKLPRGDEVALVHLNDVPAGDIMQMNDSHRVLPGEGVLPLREALGYLGDNGYEGALSVEVFSPELWDLPPAEVARRAHEATASVVGGAGY